jgi:hypothetical protein
MIVHASSMPGARPGMIIRQSSFPYRLTRTTVKQDVSDVLQVRPAAKNHRGWLQLQMVLRHPSGHLGQATLTRKRQGLGSGGR